MEEPDIHDAGPHSRNREAALDHGPQLSISIFRDDRCSAPVEVIVHARANDVAIEAR